MDITFHDLTISMADVRRLSYSAVTITLYIYPHPKSIRGIMKILKNKEENFTEQMGILVVKQVESFDIQ